MERINQLIITGWVNSIKKEKIVINRSRYGRHGKKHKEEIYKSEYVIDFSSNIIGEESIKLLISDDWIYFNEKNTNSILEKIIYLFKEQKTIKNYDVLDILINDRRNCIINDELKVTGNLYIKNKTCYVFVQKLEIPLYAYKGKIETI